MAAGIAAQRIKLQAQESFKGNDGLGYQSKQDSKFDPSSDWMFGRAETRINFVITEYWYDQSPCWTDGSRRKL